MSSSAGPIEGKYEVIAKIREGGMGAIYKVRHRLLNELRVIKVMRPEVAESADQRKRFLREAQTATRLKHENVVSFYDFFVDDEGTAYMVMEYIEGINLRDMIRQCGPIPVGLALFLSKQSLSALSYLHRKGIIHRDISPDNIMMMQEEDGTLHAKLIDLGIAKLARAEEQEQLTAADEFIGKLRYSSPEQLTKRASSSQIDGRSDLFSFGVVIYEGLTGVCPYGGGSLQDILQHRLHKPPFAFTETDPRGKVGPALRTAVLRALEKRPEDRYQDADAFAAALAAIPAGDGPAEDPAQVKAYAANAIEVARKAAIAAAPVGANVQATLQSKFRSSEVSGRPVEATDMEAKKQGASFSGRAPTAGSGAAAPDDKTLAYAGPQGAKGTEDLSKPAKEAARKASPMGGYVMVAVGAALVVAIAVGLSVFLNKKDTQVAVAPTAIPAPPTAAPAVPTAVMPTPVSVAQVLPTQPPPVEKATGIASKKDDRKTARRDDPVAPAKNPAAVPTTAAVQPPKSGIRFCSQLEDTDYKQGVSKEIASGFQDKAARAPRPDSGLMVIHVSVSPEHPREDQPAFIKVRFENGGDNPVRIEQVQESLSRGGTRNVPNIALPVIVNPGGVKDLFEAQIDLTGGEPYNKQFVMIDNRGDSWKSWFHLRPCS
jgi:tRNA A-37 threonylcarbamoyl transferase component Bud32